MSRASLVYPACAVGERPSMARAWSYSHGNGWRLTAVVTVPAILPVLPSDVAALFGVSLEAHAYLLPLNAAVYLLSVVEIAALSLAYRHFAPDATREIAAPEGGEEPVPG